MIQSKMTSGSSGGQYEPGEKTGGAETDAIIAYLEYACPEVEARNLVASLLLRLCIRSLSERDGGTATSHK